MTEVNVRAELATVVILIGTFLFPPLVPAEDVKIFDDGSVALWARADLMLMEAPIALMHNGVLVNDSTPSGPDFFEGVEIFDRVPNTDSFPLTWVDLIGNCFFRATYQKSDGTTGSLGTSIMACPSFRTPQGVLRFVPTVSMADIETDLSADDRVRSTLTGHFDADMHVTSVRTYPDPDTELTDTGLSVGFSAPQAISLDTSQLGNDAFRFVTISSMFSTNMVYDANVLRWETPDGRIGVRRLTDSTPRDTHLLATDNQLGCWLELIKEPGSSWFPDSPTIRIDISDCGNVTQQLGIQGFLAATLDPNDDSLSVWIEWLDAPNPIPANAGSSLSFSVTATPPSVMPMSFADGFEPEESSATGAATSAP